MCQTTLRQLSATLSRRFGQIRSRDSSLFLGEEADSPHFCVMVDVEFRSARYHTLPAIASLGCSAVFTTLGKGVRFPDILWVRLHGIASEHIPSSRSASVRLSVGNELHIRFDRLIQTVNWLPWSRFDDTPSLYEPRGVSISILLAQAMVLDPCTKLLEIFTCVFEVDFALLKFVVSVESM